MTVVNVKKENHVAYITMNRPDKRNALSKDLVLNLITALTEADEDPEVRVVILSGEGKAFCAGGDLETILGLKETQEIITYMDKALDIIHTMRQMKTYVVAAVHGFAAGAGFSIALGADFIVSDKDATFLSNFSNVGLIPDLGLIKALSEKLPINIVKELISGSKPLSAEVAQNYGLINEVVEGDIIEETTKFAQFVIDGPPLANQYVKQFVNQVGEMSDLTASLQEKSIQTLLMQSEDNKEGINAFFEKRKPQFKGR